MRDGTTRVGTMIGAKASRGGLILFLALSLAAAAVLKIKVTTDGAGLKATPDVGASTLARIPFDTILQVEAKQGEWYKVTCEVTPGNRVSGFIHELLVTVVEEPAAPSPSPAPVQDKPAPAKEPPAKEPPAKEAPAKDAPVKEPPAKPADVVDRAQLELQADLDVQVGRSRDLIRRGAADEALGLLSPLAARAARLADRGRQQQSMTEIFFLKGLAFAAKGDEGAARKEFRNMFEVSEDEARKLAKNVFDGRTVALLKLAEGEFMGLVTEYALEIATEPAGAKVKIDGRDLGPSPVSYKTSTTRALVEIEREGFRSIREDIELSQPTTRKSYRLSPSFFNLAVRSTPSGAKIFLDGKDTGTVTNGELSRLAAGAHAVRLVKEFHADAQIQVELGEGAPPAIDVALVVSSYAAHGAWGGPGSPFFKNPSAIAVDRRDRIVVLDESPVKLKVFNRLGEVTGDSGAVALGLRDMVNPAGAAIGPAGEIYVADSESHAVFKLDPGGRVLARWGAFGSGREGLNTPLGLAVDEAGAVYVADAGNGRVKIYTPEGEVKALVGGPGEGNGRFHTPRALALNGAGELYVLDSVRVQKFSVKGEWVASWGRLGSAEGEFRSPAGLCVDAAGSVYVADAGNHRIQKFDGQGRLICAWGSNGKESGLFDQPVGVAVDGSGIVYVVDRNNQRIQLFTAGAAALGGSEPLGPGPGDRTLPLSR